jgi:Icc-related predicted phosphoesterase
MRVLLVSDVHYRLRQYDWIYDAAPDVDVVVIAGDLLDIRSAVPLPAQAVAVSAQIGRIGGRGVLLAASGNHDLDERDAAEEKVAGWLQRVNAPGLHVDGESPLIEGTLFTICGWWDGPAGRDVLDARLAVDAARDKQRWVWVYHSPPSGSPLSWDGRRQFGDQELADWIERFSPDLVLTGHVHQAPFVDGGGWADRLGDTWVFNAGQQSGPVPAHILIDLEAGQASWLSATDRETVGFAEH